MTAKNGDGLNDAARSYLEAVSRRIHQEYEEQFRQVQRRSEAQEELWKLVDQLEEISIKAAQHMGVLQEQGMELPEIAKLMCVPRGVARMFLEIAEDSKN